jgi:hypothetical protein
MSQFGYPEINKAMFMHDWNANIPSYKMAKTYKLKTVSRVDCYASKLRKEGFVLVRRSHKEEAHNDN